LVLPEINVRLGSKTTKTLRLNEGPQGTTKPLYHGEISTLQAFYELPEATRPDTRDAFNTPHDLKILKEVFKVENGDYARENSFWKCFDLIELASEQGTDLTAQVERIKTTYNDLSATYQEQKDGSSIPLS